MATLKKTTTVVTETTKDGKTVRTTTTTSTSDVDPKDVEAFEAEAKEMHAAMQESSEAMGKLFDGFGERMDAVFAPLRNIGKRKP